MTDETKIIEDVTPEDDFVFEFDFDRDPFDYDSLDWYAEAVDAYMDSNFEKAKVAAMLADFRLELEEEMDEEDEDEDEDEEVEESEEEPEEDEAEAEDEDAVELEEIQVATGEELIKAILKAHDLTQAELAEAAGISRSSVSTNLNKGVNAIQLDDFVAYVDALGYEIIVLPKNAEQNDAVYALTPETQVEAE